MGLNIKKDDNVLVISGKEKGKQGRVLSVVPQKDVLIIEKINMIKRHMKPNKTYTQGGIIEKEGSLHISSVMLMCPRCNRPTRVSSILLEGGAKVRGCKKCKEVIDR
ncbi:50S ribosomal protein L24 [bacterium BMS3Abin07]|nr:50S ribosomal protein L24 [bacterium BMS3Abin07]GBE33376.1 50S ribosomal protein L24 [bacterium BMS3Bbin05]HDL20442.1 50S ribosomal protein L24 [Nitrospirota bacterium]HDO21927.1 50S ribosomal protein L24 [Nitrospirota bacterium]HDZ87725.1 50S ribosomal protein L24 [Nitrospirota bacterium]